MYLELSLYELSFTRNFIALPYAYLQDVHTKLSLLLISFSHKRAKVFVSRFQIYVPPFACRFSKGKFILCCEAFHDFLPLIKSAHL